MSGAKDRRPALDQLLTDAKRRRFDVVVCWRLDRLGRNLKHLITLLDELQSLGVAFVSWPRASTRPHRPGSCRCTSSARSRSSSAAGLSSGSELALARAQAHGVKLGRPRRRIDPERLALVAGLPDREAARRLGIPRSTLQRALAQKPAKSIR